MGKVVPEAVKLFRGKAPTPGENDIVLSAPGVADRGFGIAVTEVKFLPPHPLKMILCGGIGGLNVHQKPHTGGCFPDCGKDLGAKALAPLVLCHGKVDDM